MRIHCLSSFELKNPITNLQPEDASTSLLTLLDISKKKILINSHHCGFTEIRIGRKDEYSNFFLVLYRDGIQCLEVSLKPEAIEITPKIKKEGKTAEVIRLQITDDADISAVNIRFIKVFSKTVKLQNIIDSYKNYANLLRGLVGSYNDETFKKRQDEAFKTLGPLIVPNEGEPKSRNQAISDLYDAIEVLCSHETLDRIHVVLNSAPVKDAIQITNEIVDDFYLKHGRARFNNYLVNDDEIIFHSQIYNRRAEKSTNFRYCRVLEYDNVKLEKVNLRWFTAINLISLTFNRVHLFNHPDTKKLLAENIGHFANLKILIINNCEGVEFDEKFFSNLSKTVTYLDFCDTGLEELPTTIQRVVNLRKLALTGNESLKDEGFPWEWLPTKLEALLLTHTGITKIPKSIGRLKKLKSFSMGVKVLTDVDLSSFPSEIKTVMIGSEVPIKKLNSTLPNNELEELAIAIQNLTLFDDNNLSPDIRVLNLSFNKLQAFEFHQSFEALTKIDLAGNQLKTLAWETLPVNLEELDLSCNQLTYLGPLNHIRALKKLDLSLNKLQEISKDLLPIDSRLLHDIDLSFNNLNALPPGFENLGSNATLYLDLSGNKFSSEQEKLEEIFWSRLPVTHSLQINWMKLRNLPCSLKGKITNLHAVDCNLKWVCPKICDSPMGKITYINIAKNPEITSLPLVPKTIYQPPLAKVKIGDDPEESRPRFVLLTDIDIFRYTEKFLTRNNKPYYAALHDILENTNAQFPEDLRGCKCCATCDNFIHEKVVPLEQAMVMDGRLRVVKDTEIFKPINKKELRMLFLKYNSWYLGWNQGQWKTIVKTHMCKSCIKEFLTKADKAYNELEKAKPAVATKETTKKIKLGNQKCLNQNDTDENEGQDDTVIPNNNQESSEHILLSSSLTQRTPDLTIDNTLTASVQLPVNSNSTHVTVPPTVTIETSYYPPNPTSSNFPFSWSYFYPSYHHLFNFCSNYNFHFDHYPYANLPCGYSICGLTNLLTKTVHHEANSGFRALSYLITGSEDSFGPIKYHIRNHILQNRLPQGYYVMFPNAITLANDPNNIEMTDHDIYAAANLLGVNIFVFTPQIEVKWYLYNDSLFDLSFSGTNFDPSKPSILLSKPDGTHFAAVLGAS